MKMPDNISKRLLWRYLNKKLRNVIPHGHVLGVMTILFEEMILDLKNNLDIKIFNLGTITLSKTKSRKYHDVRYKCVMYSPGKRILKFKVAPKLRKKIKESIDIDKTFGSD